MEVAVVIIVVFFLLCLFAYAWLAVFHPEWVGITGAKAREIEATHKNVTESEPQDGERQ